jgi:histidyl-tRNA synthetase
LTTAFTIIDKLEREEAGRSRERLIEECGLAGEAADRVLALFDRPGLDAISESFGSDEEVAAILSELAEYRGILDGLGLGAYVEFDLKIVRGLAYYTGIVFELFDRNGEFRAICGGGRYDRLLELVGGEPLPAVGFGMGDVVLTELLAARELLPSTEREADLFIITIVPELRPLAIELARTHRALGRRVLYALRAQSVKKQFSAAAVEGARWVVILGPAEVERGVGVVRDMASGSEQEVALEDLKKGGGFGDGGI